MFTGIMFLDQRIFQTLDLGVHEFRDVRHLAEFLEDAGMVDGLRGGGAPGEGAVTGDKRHGDLGGVEIVLLEAVDDLEAGLGLIVVADAVVGHELRAGDVGREMVRMGGAVQRNGARSLRPAHGERGVRVDDAADGRECLVQFQVGVGVAGGTEFAVGDPAVKSDDHDVFGRKLFVVDAGGLDGEDAGLAVDAADVAERIDHEAEFRQLHVGLVAFFAERFEFHGSETFLLQRAAEPEVALIEFFVQLDHFLVRRVFGVEARAHLLHGVLYAGVVAGRDRAEHGAAERAGLVAGGDLDREIEDVGAHLHDERGLAADAAGHDDVADRDGLRLEVVDDGARAVDGAFGKGAVDHRGGRAEVESADRAGEFLVGVRRTTAVEPVEREDAGGPDGNGGGFLFDRGDLDVARIGEETLEPGVDVAERGLTGFEADHAGDHGAVHLTADAGDAAVDLGCHKDVAGAGAADLDQVVGVDLGADRAEMAVERAGGDHDVRGKAEAVRPLLRQLAGRLVAGHSVLEQAVAEPGEHGIEPGEEVLRRKSAPTLMPHGLVPGGAAAARHGERVDVSGQFGGDPVAVLHPAERRLADGFAHAERVEDLREEPFAGVDAALIHGVVRAAVRLGVGIDLISLEDGRMVFPEDEHGVRIVLELRQHGQRDAFAVDGARGGSGGIDADADHALLLDALHDALDDDLEALKIVQRVLAELVVRSVAVFAFAPAGVVLDAGGEDLAALHVDQHGSYAVGTEIKSNRQLTAHGFLLRGMFGNLVYVMLGRRSGMKSFERMERARRGRTRHGTPRHAA